MKKVVFLLIALGIIFFSLSCEQEENCIHPVNSMNLEELQVGQVFRFVLLRGESYRDPDNFDFDYTGDTLEVKVVDQQGEKFLLSERITPLSNVMLDTTNTYYWYDKDSVYTNFWEIKNDSLLVTPANGRAYNLSHLLFNYKKFPLADFDGEKVGIRGWRPDITFPITDYNGSTFIYSRKHGFVRTSTYSAWTAEGVGWDRVE